MHTTMWHSPNALMSASQEPHPILSGLLFFSREGEMETHMDERRKFKRYLLTMGMLFTDQDNTVGLAKIIDISRSGVKCCTLSHINCTICNLENIELFGAEEDLILTGLSGRMTRCSNDLSERKTNQDFCFYEFGFEFFPQHHERIKRLQEHLLSYQ